jgi:hypothetical protein
MRPVYPSKPESTGGGQVAGAIPLTAAAGTPGFDAEAVAEKSDLPHSIVETVSVPARRLVERIHLGRWGWVASAVILFLAVLALILANPGARGNSPAETELVVAPVSTTARVKTPVSSPTLPPPPIVLGGADKLAFLNDSQIWISNLDGSGLQQLTDDATVKANLQWTQDGQAVLFTSAGCIYSADLESQQFSTLTCFESTVTIRVLRISPDGTQIAIGLSTGNLYVADYARVIELRRNSSTSDLQEISTCTSGALYHTNDQLKAVRWSQDGTRLAVLLSPGSLSGNGDLVRILRVDACQPGTLLVAEILPTYFLFTLPGYYTDPSLSSLDWNGDNLLLWTGSAGPDDFGTLQLYDLSRVDSQALEPLGGQCCYREAQYSPDDSYLLFAYQPEAGGEVALYYLPLANPQSSTTPRPLAFPADFLTNPLAGLQAALRRAP